MIARTILTAVLIAGPAAAAGCDGLTALRLANTTITAANVVAAGAFTPPAAPGAPAASAASAFFKTLPAFCRVQGVIRPSADSNIEFEVWLPESGWNGKYFGAGNGGFAGSINYGIGASGNTPGMPDALLAGYAVSSTDTGHKGSAIDGRWALGHPEKIVDYGYRAVHETAEKSKAVIRAFYGQAPRRSYFASCSNGGRQAMMEAQRFAGDYDGIIAGAPAYSFTHILAAFTLNIQATDGAGYIPGAKFPAIEAAALAACDALDGIHDGVIDDPRACRFDPASMLCQGAETNACLTQPQAAALKKIYAGASSAKLGRVYPGFVPGGESGWPLWFSGARPGQGLQYLFATSGHANIIFQQPDWDYRAYDLDRDLRIADQAAGQQLNATDPDLRAFRNRGGKLIIWHGWSDAALAPASTIDYHESVVAKMGRKNADSFLRVYLAPGLAHCEGGPGANTFGRPMMAALEGWVENSAAPDRIVATKYKTDGNPASGVVRTRPLCPYPQVARYRGSGSTDEAGSFVCAAPARR
jgi:feruloyl esterase